MVTNTKCIGLEKKRDLKEEFKLIQVNIGNWIRNSLYIKNWAISIWALMTVFILTQYDSPDNNNINYAYLLLITVFIPFPFWLFDALFKKFERIAIARSCAIQDYLIGSLQKIDKETRKEYRRLIKQETDDKNIKEKIKKKELNEKCNNKIEKSLEHNGKIFEDKFPLYDPVGRISCKNLFYRAKYLRLTSTWRCIFVRIVSMIYLMLIIISLTIFSIVYGQIIQLQLCFTCPIDLSLIWPCVIFTSSIYWAINLSIGLVIIWYKCEKWEI